MSTITSPSRKKPKLGALIAALFILTNLFFGLPSPAPIAGAQGEQGLARARRQMVERDLRGRGIQDERVLAAMNATPRHLFVPEPLRASAYDDRALPIGDGQTISQPYIVAFMSELLELKAVSLSLEDIFLQLTTEEASAAQEAAVAV